MVAMTQTTQRRPNMPTTAKRAFNTVRAGNRANGAKRPGLPGRIPGQLPGPQQQPTGALQRPQQDFRNTMQNALQNDVQRDVNAPDAYTQAQLGLLDESAQRQRQQQIEDLKRYGVLSSGNTADVLGTFDVGTERTRQAVIGEGFNRALAERRAGLSQGLLLSDSDYAAQQAQAQLAEQIAARRGTQGLQQQQVSNQADQFGRSLEEQTAARVGSQGLTQQQINNQNTQFGSSLAEQQAARQQQAQQAELERQAVAQRQQAEIGFGREGLTQQNTQFNTGIEAERLRQAERLQSESNLQSMAQQNQLNLQQNQFGENKLTRTFQSEQAQADRGLTQQQINNQNNQATNQLAEVTAGRLYGGQQQALERSLKAQMQVAQNEAERQRQQAQLSQQGSQFDRSLTEEQRARMQQEAFQREAQNYEQRMGMADRTGVVGGGPINAGALGVEGIIRDFRAREGSAAPGEREAAYAQVAQRFAEQTGRAPTDAEVNDLFGFRTVNPGTVQTLEAQRLSQAAQQAAADRELQTTLQSGQFGENALARTEASRQAALDRGVRVGELTGSLYGDDTLAAQQLAQQGTQFTAAQLQAAQQAGFDRNMQRELAAGEVLIPGLGRRDTVAAQQVANQNTQFGQSLAQQRDLTEAQLMQQQADRNQQAQLALGNIGGNETLAARQMTQAEQQAERDRQLALTLQTQGNQFQMGLTEAQMAQQRELALAEMTGRTATGDQTLAAQQLAQQGGQFQSEQQRLITDATRSRELEMQRLLEGQRQFDAQNQLAQAGLTGQLGDQQTLQAQQLAQQNTQFGRSLAEQQAARTDAQRLAQIEMFGGEQGINANDPAVSSLLDRIRSPQSLADQQTAMSDLERMTSGALGRPLAEEDFRQLLAGNNLEGRQTLQAREAAATRNLQGDQMNLQRELAIGQITDPRTGRTGQTLDARQLAQQDELARAGLTGQLGDQQTLAAQQLAQQNQQFGSQQDLTREQLLGQVRDPRTGLMGQSLDARQLAQQNTQFGSSLAEQIAAREQQNRQFASGQQLAREELTGQISQNNPNAAPMQSLQAQQLAQQNQQFNSAQDLARQEAIGQINFGNGQWRESLARTGMNADIAAQQAGLTGQYNGQDTLQASSLNRQNNLDAISIGLALQESNLPLSARRELEQRLTEATGQNYGRTPIPTSMPNPENMSRDELVDYLRRLNGLS